MNEENVFKLEGTKIGGFTINKFGEVIIYSDNNTRRFITTKEMLITILSEFDFTAIKKKTRTHLSINIDDWRVERFDEVRTY